MTWITKNRPAIVLAPMEGVTDAPTRAVLTEIGGYDYCVTEFIRVSDLIPPGRVFRSFVPELNQSGRTGAGTPVQIQILGGDPEMVAETAVRAVSLGAGAIDINFGCPAPTVNRHDGGAALLRHPDRIFRIVDTVRRQVPREIPVSAKLRLGWDEDFAILQNAAEVEKAGADWITIHGRTKVDGYGPAARWEMIGEVRRRLTIPVVANGDIRSVEAYRRCREITGCEHVMIGRGALADPFLAKKIRASEFGEASVDWDVGVAPHAWGKLLHRFSESYGPRKDREMYLARRIKQWLNLARVTHEIPWFHEIKRLQSGSEILDWLANSGHSKNVL